MKIKIQIEIEIDSDDVQYPVSVREDEYRKDGEYLGTDKYTGWFSLRQLAKTQKDKKGDYYIHTNKKAKHELCQEPAEPVVVSGKVIGGTLGKDFRINADIPGLGTINLGGKTESEMIIDFF